MKTTITREALKVAPYLSGLLKKILPCLTLNQLMH